MTLENCKLRLAAAQKANNEKDIKLWEDRILFRETRLGIVKEVKPKKAEVGIRGKKSA